MSSAFVPALLALIVCAGCATPSASVGTREPYVKPSMVMLTADQAARRNITIDGVAPSASPLPKDIDALDASAVTAPADIKVYTIGRAVDPADREMLHEQHVVYRRENAQRWRLDAPVDQKILVGPRVTDGRQDIQPLLSKELTTFLADERRTTEANQKAISALFQAVDAINRQQQTLLRQVGKKTTTEKNAATTVPVEEESGRTTEPAEPQS